MNKALILINKIKGKPAPDEQDVLAQAEEVEKALRKIGYEPHRLFVDLNLDVVKRSVRSLSPSVVINLVETLGGKAELIHLIPSLLESMDIPFTGSGSFPMSITSDKIRAKNIFQNAEIPTPEWITKDNRVFPDKSKHYILKPVWEDGSVGISDQSVISGDSPDILSLLADLDKKLFFEEYIHGREFNLSLLEGPEGPEIFPPAEIKFINYPSGKPHILNYASKWDEDSFEYINSVRSFDFGREDEKVLAELKKISYQCWNALELSGYARVDFRVDKYNCPFVLEVNANPCISPDAGFMAAANVAGLDYPDVIKRIINVALSR